MNIFGKKPDAPHSQSGRQDELERLQATIGDENCTHGEVMEATYRMMELGVETGAIADTAENRQRLVELRQQLDDMPEPLRGMRMSDLDDDGADNGDDPVPTTEQVEALPHWAVVAFAARCANRVRPLVTRYWPDAQSEHIAAVDEALQVAESVARDGATGPDASRIVSILKPLRSVPSELAAGYAVEAAHNAVRAAASNVANPEDVSYAAMMSQGAANAASLAASCVSFAGGVADDGETGRAIGRDFRMLSRAAAAGNWSNMSPVPATVFGPMWPSQRQPEWSKAE